jgi:hypothetical protein
MKTRRVERRKQQKGNKRRSSAAGTRRLHRQRGGNAEFQTALSSAKLFLNDQIYPGMRLLNMALLDAKKHSPSEMDSEDVANLLHHAERMERRAEKMRGELNVMSAGHTAKSIIRAKTSQ